MPADKTPDLLPTLRIIALGSALLAGTVAVLLFALEEGRGAAVLGAFAVINVVFVLLVPLVSPQRGPGSSEG